MATSYNLEPQPTASCILHTTSGDLSLELWAQQVPLTCRNFLQHCIDGYYNDTIFHRLVPGFIIQGGDPTGTGSGGESIYDGGVFSESREEHGIWPMEERKGRNAGLHGIGFKDEFHSRIKYNRRGILGMANEGPDSNGSQFFLTLGNTPELQGKNTMFGRIEGDTIYNLAKMGEAEVDGDRPLYPIKITTVEVMVNPFEDMVVRSRTAVPTTAGKISDKKKKKRKAGKQLLSFGGEEGEDEAAPIIKKAKFDTRIVMDVVEENEALPAQKPAKKAEKRTKRAVSPESAETPPEPQRALPTRSVKLESPQSSASPEPQISKVSSLLERTNAEIAELKASMKRNIQTAPAPEKKKSALEAMIPTTSVRGRKRGGNAKTDQQSVDLLNAFRAKLEQAPPEKEAVKDKASADAAEVNFDSAETEEAALCDLHFIADCQSCKKWDNMGETGDQDDDEDEGWMSHALTFKDDKLGKDLSYRKKAEEELVVIDPREKARTLKEEMRAQREARSGGSSRAWDQARNEKLARSSALAGRGAK